jgi:hypothetical protein
MIDMKITQMFFDRKKVIDAVDRAKRQALSRVGAYIRQAARSSIKNAPFIARKKRGEERTDLRRRTSRPGRPPYSQTGLLKRGILFGYDRNSDSVVIGPVFLHGRAGRDVPRILEEGGHSQRGRDKRTVRIAARPYMRPAMMKELPNIPAAFRNSVRSR